MTPLLSYLFSYKGVVTSLLSYFGQVVVGLVRSARTWSKFRDSSERDKDAADDVVRRL